MFSRVLFTMNDIISAYRMIYYTIHLHQIVYDRFSLSVVMRIYNVAIQVIIRVNLLLDVAIMHRMRPNITAVKANISENIKLNL